MNRMKWRLTFLAGLALAIAFLSQLQAGGIPKSESKVKATAAATKVGADGKQSVTITLAIDKGWYIYANPINTNTKAEGQRQNQTNISFTAKENVKASVKYPAGKLKVDDEYEFDIYEGSVVIQAQVQRTPGDTSALKISIDVNACDKGTCLPRGKVSLTIP